jgi:cell wall-associated NlpC family hydrolase
MVMLSRQFARNIMLAIIVWPITTAFAIEASTPDASGSSGSATMSNISSDEVNTSPAEISNSTTPDVVRDVLQYALSHEGKTYRRGGMSPESGFDCSGFVLHVFDHVGGVELPHSASALGKMGRLVNKTELVPGDLVFFHRAKKHISHVGIYLGDNKFIHASSRRTGRVMVSDLNDRYWAKHFVSARHLELNRQY